MRITTWSFPTLAASLVALGALTALVIAFFVASPHYISNAVLTDSAPDPRSVIATCSQVALSRANLLHAIIRFRLYPRERANMPMEDVIEKMRTSIVIRPTQDVRRFEVKFDYPDRFVAPKVCTDLARGMIEANLEQRGGGVMQLLDPATLPQRPLYPKRPLIATEGALAGLLLAMLVRFAVTRTRTVLAERP